MADNLHGRIFPALTVSLSVVRSAFHRSCMMVLRECVRRHGRLPQILVVDGGIDSTASTSRRCWHATNAPRRPGLRPLHGSDPSAKGSLEPAHN
jgi:hypothetical protein